jgi:hypothetical protein
MAPTQTVASGNIPEVIPPRSVVILASVDRKKTPDWSIDRRRIFRIGYYNRNDGLDCIWLVNGAGDYERPIGNHFSNTSLSCIFPMNRIFMASRAAL